MLQTLVLQNFKPIRGPLEIEFGDVTILAGLNSSGKSSVLQAILMLSQTFGHSNYDRSLVPNGNQVQLGLLSQVKNENANASEPVSIGFSLRFNHRERRKAFDGARSRIVQISVNASFQPIEEDTGILRTEGGASLTALSMQIDTIYQRSIKLQAAPMSPEEAEAYTEGTTEQDKQRWKFEPGIPYRSIIETFLSVHETSEMRPMAPSTTCAARMRHFMPERVVVRQKTDLAYRTLNPMVSIIKNVIDSPSLARYASEVESNLPMPIPEEIVKGFYDYVRGNKIFEKITARRMPSTKSNSITDFIIWLRDVVTAVRLPDADLTRLRRNLAQKVERDINRWAKTGDVFELSPLRTVDGEIIEEAVKEATNFFIGKIRYLGPLRVDPLDVQSFSPSSELDDVGSRGQYAAAVYDANRLKRIRWWNPKSGREDSSPLEHALNVWLQHLGVAYQIHTSEARETRVAWRVLTRPGARDRPLSAVGVGVSQVVPILVAGLLAPLDSLLLLEQPELHLHMRAQARLGDFFVGLSKTGKRCLIETHSDCLVNQMRLYIVQSSQENAAAQIRVLFAEQDDNSGHTTFCPIKISKKGNITNWPDGFFDQTIRQEEAITKAALRNAASNR